MPPLEGTLEELQPRWLALAKRRRAVDLPRLLDSILHTTQRSGVAIVEALARRGEALAEVAGRSAIERAYRGASA